MVARRGSDKVLRPVHPNVGLEVAYRKRLHKLIEELHGSTLYWVKASYRANPPIMAQDISIPASMLTRTIKALRKRWLKKFDETALKLGDYFAKAVSKRTDAQLKKILKEGGMSVEFSLTPAQRDVLTASINENVSLIKTIPRQYLNDVEGIVMRSVQAGHDLGFVADEIQKRYHLTRKRATLIARDQSAKITGQLTRARQIEVGITKAKWLHSHAGKVPRPTHVAMHGEEYDVVVGMYDPDKRVQRNIFPGELINCRCVSKSIVKGFS